MDPFVVHILGCGSALPTLKHNPSCQVVEIRGKMFMLDCGEGAQTALRRSKISFQRIRAIFISHLHGDHCFGLIGFISTLGLLDRTAPLHIYAPAEMKPLLDLQLQMFFRPPSFEVVFHAVDTTKQEIIYEDHSLTVTTIPLEHRIPCCGYLLKEKPTLPHIRPDMLEFYKIPFSQVGNIKNGADWVTDEGERIANERLVRPADAPRSYAYCSDTRYVPTLHERIKNVSLLYHESTYDEANLDRAERYFHSTGAQAATVARDAEAHQLLLGHYSARYSDEGPILEEAQKIFPNTILSQEGMAVDVKN